MDSLLCKIPCGSPVLHIDNSRESVQKDEGRKQLADMLHMEDRVPLKSLGIILSFPGFCSQSPIFSPRLSAVTNDSSKGKDEWMDFSKHGLGFDNIKRRNEEETQNISDCLSKALETAANKQEKDSIPLSIVNHVSNDDESTPRESWLMHVRSVFELGSDLGYNELENHLLDPSVFDELQNKYRQRIDSSILSDYINEVTVDICIKFLRPTTPSIFLLVKPNVSSAQTKETFMHELCKGLEPFILMDFQRTLYHITRVDLEMKLCKMLDLTQKFLMRLQMRF